MSHELYKKHRPATFKRVYGQEGVVRQLIKQCAEGRMPHASLFTGPSGCGKTTLARIVMNKLECGPADFTEMNAAEETGIDGIRTIKQRMGNAPMDGKVRIWLIDECHQLTTQAQNAFLKLLEDTPKHVYFMLATTNPGKLLPTVKTRTSEYKVSLLNEKVMGELLADICKRESLKVGNECLDMLIKYAEGSPRKALVLLDQIMGETDDDKRIECLHKATAELEGIALARVLFKKGVTWPEVQKTLNDVKEDPESIRWIVLGYAKSILRGKAKPMWNRAAQIIELFQDNFYDSKDAGLTLACYGAVN